MAATLYDRVALRAWDGHSAAGNAAASWAAVAQGQRALRRDPVRGWCGLVDAYGGDPVSLLHQAAIAPWHAIGHVTEPAALGLSASKGNPWAVDRALHGHPQAWLTSDGDAVNRAVAGRLNVGAYIPCAVAAACSTGLYAVLAAADLIERGYCQHALAGAVDGDLPPWLAAGFSVLGVLCGDTAPEAFGTPTGFAPAAGAGVLALAHEGPWRLAAGVRLGDAGHETHFTDPRTLTYALDALWAAVPHPDLIITHGTGTAAGDAYEARGLDAGPWRRCTRVSMKPILGHCLGASGAVELASACHAPVQRLWKLSLGFGGHLAAVALVRS